MRLDRRRKSGLLMVVVGLSCFAIQLWWEVPPHISQEVLSNGIGLDIRGEVTGETH